MNRTIVDGDVLESYASGNGALSFVFTMLENGRRVAAPRRVRIEDVPKELIRPGWILAKVNGEPQAFLPYQRVNADHIHDPRTGRVYRYTRVHEQSCKFLTTEDGCEMEVMNISTTGAMRFWINHEDVLAPLTLDYSI